eukprot:3699434-Alexandrium_andersonii.AAC.1
MLSVVGQSGGGAPAHHRQGRQELRRPLFVRCQHRDLALSRSSTTSSSRRAGSTWALRVARPWR